MDNNAINAQSTQFTILFIDDNFNQYLKTLTIVANSYGFNIEAFNNVDEGLAFLDANHKNIATVILDIGFPEDEIQGPDALTKIKSNYDLLPVIMLTGGDTEEDIELAINCMKMGATNYVGKKRFNPTHLLQVIQSAFQQYQTNIEIVRHKALKEEYRTKNSAYEKMLYTTEMILNNILNNKLMFPPTFEKRVKEFNSFYEKLKDKEKIEGFKEDPFKRITDIAGLRIIFYNAVDLQKAVELLQASNDFVDFKDGSYLIADDKSKTLGYRAVHFDVKLNAKKRLHLEEYQLLLDIPCELQFKTIFAHSWSKVHHALSYKEIGEMKLTAEKQQQLDEDFKVAAKNLESIEQQITSLCAESYLNMKSTTNSN